MRKTSDKERDAVMALGANERFQYFVKRAADSHLVWGLWCDGWAAMFDGEQKEVFPVWPAEEFAAVYRDNFGTEYVPKSIDVNEFIELALPALAARKIQPGVFPVLPGKGLIVPAFDLVAALNRELGKYQG